MRSPRISSKEKVPTPDHMSQYDDPRSFAPELVLITGRGRSGTSWIGRVLASNPDASYHYETFLKSKRTPYLRWLQQLRVGDPRADRAALMDLCRVPRTDVDYPPYHARAFKRYPPWASWIAFQAAKRLAICDGVFQHLAGERRAPASRILKEVNLPNDILGTLCAATACHLISVIRSPLESICSTLRGYRTKRFGPLTEQERRHTMHVLSETAITDPIPPAQVMSMGHAAFEALRWRIQTEPLVAFCEHYEHGTIIDYNRFLTDPVGQTESLYRFLGWDINESAISNARGMAGTFRRKDPYYSTRAQDAQNKVSPSEYLTETEMRDCRAILAPSPLLERWQNALN